MHSVLFAVCVLAACTGKDQGNSNGAPELGGTVVISVATNPTTLFPPLVAGNVERQIFDATFDRLADIGHDLNTVGDRGFVPVLAERWEWSSDSLSIAFHLNPRASFHDGRPVRASDVRFTVALIKNPMLGSPVASAIANVDSVSVRDSLTAVAWFHRRTPEQFYDLVYQVLILPEHLLAGTPVAELKTASVTNTDLGSGRFRMSKFEPGTRVELTADTANYRGRPKLDRVVFSISPDFNAAVTRFLSGDADFFENLRAEQLATIARDTARRAVRLPALSYNFLTFNLRDPKSKDRPHPIFGERAVRVALSMAVDRRAMLKNVFDTVAGFAYGPFARSGPAADTTIAQLSFDTTKANAMLDSAGWKRQADGIRMKGTQRLAFGITTPNSSAARHSYSVLLQAAFRTIGADVKLDESDFPAYLAKLDAHTFDTQMGNFSPDPAVAGYREQWTTSGIGAEGRNYGSYSNARFDALIDSAAGAFDRTKTVAYARRAFDVIVADAPAIWLYETPTVAGVHRRIHLVNMRPDAYMSGLADWWIAASDRNARDRIGLRPAP